MNDRQEKKRRSSFANVLTTSVRLNKMLWKEKKWTIIFMFFLVIVLATMPFLQSGASGLLINALTDIKNGASSYSLIWGVALLLIVTSVAEPLFLQIQGYYDRIFHLFLEAKFDILIIQKAGTMDISSHESPKEKNLFQKIKEEGLWRIQNCVDRQFYIFQSLIKTLIGTAVVLFSQWWIFLIILLGTIPELIIEMRYGHRIWTIHTTRAETRRRYYELKGFFQEVSSIVELKLFQNIQFFLTDIKDIYRNFQETERKNEKQRLLFSLLALLLAQGTNAFALFYFIFQVTQGRLLVGTLIFILASISNLRHAVSFFFINLGKQYQDSLFANDVFAFLDTKAAIIQPTRGIALSKKKTPSIVLEHVTFAYPQTNKKVLNDVSLTINPGERLAVVGINGAGKTTLVKLLCRFYDPTKGKILIDGNNLKDIDLESWYAELGIIFQDYARYHFIVKDAIALGATDERLSLQRVKQAAKASESDTFIEEWEKKYKQMLGKDFTEGVEPSIGQWQKLALARTFYRDPRVLILDEPTSSIDAEAEEKIFERLESLKGDRTVILISHRFSTVRRAQRIAVIDHGKLKELGSHEELLRQNDIYAKLFRLQAKGYQ